MSSNFKYVIIASVFGREKVTEKGRMLDTAQLIRDNSSFGKTACALPNADEIIVHLLPQLEQGDVVAVMSNGGFDGIHEKLLSELRQG